MQESEVLFRSRRATHHENPDVLSLLLAATDEAGQPLSDKEIRDELVTFLVAGHDTTATALTWTWFLLSQFRTVRERLAHELATVLDNRLPTAADVPRLVYTKMIWDESLRLYPPAWLLHSRKSRAEDRLPSGVLLPAGTRVFQSPWSMHRNARWFPDPNRFDPDRFSPEAKADAAGLQLLSVWRGWASVSRRIICGIGRPAGVGDTGLESPPPIGRRTNHPSGSSDDVEAKCPCAHDH